MPKDKHNITKTQTQTHYGSHLFGPKLFNCRKSKELEEEREKHQLQENTKNTNAHVSVKNTNAHDILELKGALMVYKLSESPENAQTHYFTMSKLQCV